MEDTRQSDSVGVQVLDQEESPRKADVTDAARGAEPTQNSGHVCEAVLKPGFSLDEGVAVTPRKRRLTSPSFMVAYFAILNVIMYLTIQKFWIGGSSFLPMIGKLGPGNKFLFAMFVNVGVIIGAFIGAYTSGEFRLRLPRKRDLPKAIVGGFLIGAGVTIAPGTCTTAFVTGIPMLSISSFLSVAGLIIGSHIVYRHTLGRR